MLCLAGYSHTTELKGNKECFNNVLALITSVKARLMKHTALTVEEAATEINEQDAEADEDADEREIFSRVNSCKNREVQERREQNNSESRPRKQH